MSENTKRRQHILGDFKAKIVQVRLDFLNDVIGKEYFVKDVTRKETIHETSPENEIRLSISNRNRSGNIKYEIQAHTNNMDTRTNKREIKHILKRKKRERISHQILQRHECRIRSSPSINRNDTKNYTENNLKKRQNLEILKGEKNKKQTEEISKRVQK